MTQLSRSAVLDAGEAAWMSSVLLDVLGASRVAVAVDFDGTISPIVPAPAAAIVDPACRDALAAVAATSALVAVVSGRPVDDLRRRVGLDGLTYVGGHGGEWWPPRVDRSATGQRRLGADELAMLERRLAADIARQTSSDGLVFERKAAGLAIHFRQAAQPVRAARAIARAARNADLARLGLALLWGKCVLELRPAGAPTKGTALELMVERADLRSIVYLGDDRTDVDAFRTLRRLRDERGLRTLAIGVAGPETPPVVRRRADVMIEGVPAVARFLTHLACRLSGAGRAEPG